MPYDEKIVAPMRLELTTIGFKELRSPQDVEKEMAEKSGTMLVVVNSVCGCAAGMARPGVGMALQNNSARPDRLTTVFAGQDIEATAKMRAKIGTDIPPSSPSMALFRDGELVWMLPRHQIEGRSAAQVAQSLADAFAKFCIRQTA